MGWVAGVLDDPPGFPHTSFIIMKLTKLLGIYYVFVCLFLGDCQPLIDMRKTIIEKC